MKRKIVIELNIGGILLILLTIMLAGGKIFAGYNITWVWVFAPLWIPPLLIGVFLILIFLIAWLID